VQLKEFVSFARGLSEDHKAVTNGLRHEWSNGQLEGAGEPVEVDKADDVRACEVRSAPGAGAPFDLMKLLLMGTARGCISVIRIAGEPWLRFSRAFGGN
jgi:hypothetical protein